MLHRAPFPWLSGIALATAAAAQAPAPPPRFVAGDAAALECRVVAVAAGRYGTRLTVDVHNRGTVMAEPLEFTIEVADKATKQPRRELYQRVTLPFVGRYGRPAGPGDKQTYFVPTSLPGKRGEHTVRVRTASFYDDGAVAEPRLAFGKPTQVQRESLAGRFPVTEVEVDNPLDRDLDALVLVTLQQPTDVVELMALRVGAKQRRRWIVSGPAGSRPYLDEAAVAGPVKATSFRLVDWSLVAPPDPAAAAELLRPAYERWYRWPEGTPELSGRFVYRERTTRSDGKGHDVATTAGRFSLPPAGAPVVQRDDGAADVASLLAQAFAPVRRPDFAALVAKNELVLLAPDRVAVRGAGWSAERVGGAMQYGAAGSAGAGGDDYWVGVAGDRIVADGVGDTAPQPWLLVPRGNDWLVTRVGSDQVVYQIGWTEVDGRAVPNAWSVTNRIAGAVFSSYQFEFAELAFAPGSRLDPPLPTGDGAAALRAIWDASYRLPASPLEITADFEVTQPGRDLLWHGRTKLKGKLRLVGIGRSTRSLQCDFADKADPAIAHDLAFMVRDRLLIWFGRDLNARLPFDATFAGCTIHGQAADGSFAIDGGSIARVAVANGAIRSWRERSGGEVRFRWQQLGGRLVMTRFERDVELGGSVAGARWTEVVAVELAPAGDVLLPARIELQRIFGPDFGVETITLKNVVVKP